MRLEPVGIEAFETLYLRILMIPSERGLHRCLHDAFEPPRAIIPSPVDGWLESVVAQGLKIPKCPRWQDKPLWPIALHFLPASDLTWHPKSDTIFLDIHVWENCLRFSLRRYTIFRQREGAAYPHSLKWSILQSTRKASGMCLRKFQYGGQHLSKRKKPVNNTDIPQHQIEAIARCILPDILAFYESIEGQREFAEWKKQREAEQEKWT